MNEATTGLEALTRRRVAVIMEPFYPAIHARYPS